MKKVLFILPKGVGGAQKMTVTISHLLPKEHYAIRYVVVGKTMEDDMSGLIGDKLAITRIDVKNVWDMLTFRLMREMKEDKPDIVFCSMMYLNIRVILAAKAIGGIKIVVRNDNMLSTQSKVKKMLLKLTYKMVDIIIAQQEEMKADLEDGLNLDKTKVVVRYNPIDEHAILTKAMLLPSPYKKDLGRINYVWTGNFMPSGSKGQDILVRAFRIVHDKIPNSHLYLLGMLFENEEFTKNIFKFVKECGLENFVHFIGFVENPYPWVKNANCFVLPSRVEGLPNSLVDAMLLRIPVVATSCIPMISRMVKNGYNGIVVPSEDVGAMADAMIKALSLKDFEMTYTPSTGRDFVDLF